MSAPADNADQETAMTDVASALLIGTDPRTGRYFVVMIVGGETFTFPVSDETATRLGNAIAREQRK